MKFTKQWEVDCLEDKLIKVLESLSYPVFRQGSLSEDEQYPETFFTFWNNEETEHSAYDNQTQSVLYDYDVNVYSNNPELTYSLLKDARNLLKSNGFIIASRGYDIMSDEPTHIGRGMMVLYTNIEN